MSRVQDPEIEGDGSDRNLDPSADGIRWGTSDARWVIAATVLGSGIAFLDGTVVNVALPAIAGDLRTGVAGLQWTLDAYLVTLSSLLLLGGSLGDRLGRRRVFVIGLCSFTLASMLCGLAPSIGTLIAARALQGVGAALLVPGSLAIISATFHRDHRARAIGAWSGLAGVASAIGPFVGGWLIDSVSWRLIFLINLPLAAIAIWIAVTHVPETRAPRAGAPDIRGAVAVTLGLGGLAYALIEGSAGFGPVETASGIAGGGALIAFVILERRSQRAMLPLGLFRSGQFTGANLTTLAVYGGLGGAIFLVVVHLQVSLGYSALEAGTSLLPFTVIMLLLSARAGALAQRTGPRAPMTLGPLVAGLGLLLFARVEPGTSYAAAVLPAVTVFGLGMTLTVAPLTAAVLGAVDEQHIGVGSGVNNAVARLAGMLAVAVLPAAIGIDTGTSALETLSAGFGRAMVVCAALCAAGGLIAFSTVRTGARVRTATHPAPGHACHDADLAEHGITAAVPHDVSSSANRRSR